MSSDYGVMVTKACGYVGGLKMPVTARQVHSRICSLDPDEKPLCLSMTIDCTAWIYLQFGSRDVAPNLERPAEPSGAHVRHIAHARNVGPGCRGR